MIRPALALAAVAALAACEPVPSSGTAPQTTGSVGGIPLGDFYIVSLGSEAVPQRDATLTLSSSGISGRGPCNTFTGQYEGTLPNIKITSMNWTDLKCEGSEFENRYFQALTQMTGASYSGGVLVMKGQPWMQFEPGTPVGPLAKMGR